MLMLNSVGLTREPESQINPFDPEMQAPQVLGAEKEETAGLAKQIETPDDGLRLLEIVAPRGRTIVPITPVLSFMV